jgi:CheY-like chemotaxis protein
MRTSRILVVDDDADCRDAIAELLTEEGHLVQRAKDGREALRALEDADRLPDLVLLDLTMPELDGLGFIVEVERDARFDKLKIVVCSAAAPSSLPSRVVGWARKPIQVLELLALIESALRVHMQ